MATHTVAAMGTLVTIEVPGVEAAQRLERAFEWFREVEDRCTRFCGDSELMRLCGTVGEPVAVSGLLFEAVKFAVLLAEESGGAFDPTVGRQMESLGFNRNYQTGQVVEGSGVVDRDISYRDLVLDEENRTIMLKRALTLDLGAVAKGLAVDLAVAELKEYGSFAVDAGGDLFLAGSNSEGRPWRVGIRHPRGGDGGDLPPIALVEVSGAAVCTSGDYERVKSDGRHHVLNPGTGGCARGVASVTVVASGAMLADGLATAAFVMGPEKGISFLRRMGVEGLMITPELEWHQSGERFVAA